MKAEGLFLLIRACVVMVLMMVALSGCGTLSNDSDPFVNLYNVKQREVTSSVVASLPPVTFSLSISDMPLSDFAKWFSDKTGFGVVFSQSKDAAKITAEFKNCSPEDIINFVARRLEVSAILSGSTYYLGSLSKDDRGIFVHQLKGYDVSKVSQALSSFLSESGKIAILEGGLLLVSDTQFSLSRITAVVDQIEAISLDTWIVQYYILLKKKNFDVSYGARVVTSGELSYNLSKGQGVDADFSDIGQNFNLVLTGKSNLVSVVASPLLLMIDGEESKWIDATTVPIPRKTVSDSGTVTTTGVDYKDVGLTLSVTLRETVGGALLSTSLEDSQIVEYVEYYPTTRKSSLITKTNVRSGQIYLIGELRRYSSTDSLSDIFTFGNNRDETDMQVFCRVYKVSLVRPFRFNPLSGSEKPKTPEKALTSSKK